MGKYFQKVGDLVIVEADHFRQLLEAFRNQGYTCLGPGVRDGELLLGEMQVASDLPVGWRAEATAGSFRLVKGETPAYFGVGLGQPSWKQFFYPPAVRLWEAQRQPSGWQVIISSQEEPRFACIGMRACDLAALAVHDRVLLQGPYQDPIYRERRRQAFLVAVNCTASGGACFCASLGTGPRAGAGFDLGLTEIHGGGRHYFLVEKGAPRGAEILAAVAHRPAAPGEVAAAEDLVQQAAQSQSRSLKTDGLQAFLYDNYDNPHWEEVATRCLTCGNCALVCPTCFCHNIQDALDVTGHQAARWRRWEVCFSVDHSYIHGGAIRTSAKSRYRQWLTHKLATWLDQFGCLGCVGCGRCITWCPVGIDLIQEVRALKLAAAGAERAPSAGEREHGDH